MADLNKLIIKIQELQELHGADLEDPAAKKIEKDQFLLKRHDVITEINLIRDLIKKRNALHDRGGNRKIIIETNSEIRKEVSKAITCFTSLKDLYDKENKKRRSKLTPDDKKFRQEIVEDLLTQIEEIKKNADEKVAKLDERDADFNDDEGMGGIMIRNAELPTINANQPETTKTQAKKELFGGGGGDSNPYDSHNSAQVDVSNSNNNPGLTDEQAQNLAQIKKNDQELDQIAQQIGDGLDVLADIASSMTDELKKQDKKLDDLDAHMEKRQAQLDKTTKKAQEVLETAKAEDRFCINLILLAVIIGVGVAIYNFVK